MATVRALSVSPVPGEWADHAACRGMAPVDGVTPHPFFPPRGKRVPDEVAEACGRCPVAAQCRWYALHYPVLGIWGGTSEKQRRRWKRERRAS